jgi:hypothetical protein
MKPIDFTLNRLPILFKTANAKNSMDMIKEALATNFDALVGSVTLLTDHDTVTAIINRSNINDGNF